MGLFDRVKGAAKAAATDVASGMDVFKAGDHKREAEELRTRVYQLETMLSPQMRDADALGQLVHQLTAQKADLEEKVRKLKAASDELESKIKEKKKDLVTMDDDILVQEFGLYEPRFDFQTVDDYKAKIKSIREKEKERIKRINAKAKTTNWTVNGSAAQGRKMVGETTRLLLRAFNGECDDLVRKVKFSNIEKTIETIEKLASTISKLGSTMGVYIPTDYVQLKREEARVAYEYARFKEEEKERMRALREQEREETKLKKEIAEQRKKLEKERKQNQLALDDVLKRMQKAEGDELAALEEKKAELEHTLDEIEKAKYDVDYREANKKAGFVYVISNIGSFGENVYKIGMTRRLDPMERISELSDASVPFNFDVHAMIFTEDAPGLEAALHREFESRKVNKVNTRREFFRVTLDEIKQVVKSNYDKTVEFVDVPDAEQYRISQKMME